MGAQQSCSNCGQKPCKARVEYTTYTMTAERGMGRMNDLLKQVFPKDGICTMAQRKDDNSWFHYVFLCDGCLVQLKNKPEVLEKFIIQTCKVSF